MRHLFLFICLLLVFGACRICKKAQYYRQNEITKKYFPALSDKSYFVFRNKADTTDIDTFYIGHSYDSLLFQFAETKCDGDYYQQMGYTLQSRKQRGTADVSIYSTRSDQYHLAGTYMGFELFSNLSTEQSGEISVSNVARDTLSKLPTYAIGATNYSDVICVASNTLYTVDGRPLKYYYAPGIGLIQFDVYDKANNEIGATYQIIAYSLE